MDVYLCKSHFYHTKVNRWILKNNPTKLDNYRKLGYYKTYDNL